MKKMSLSSALCIFILLSACSSTPSLDNHQIQQQKKNSLIKTDSGWQSSSALTHIYDYQLIDVRQKEPRVIGLEQEKNNLFDSDIVFIGELHKHPGNHLAQLQIYENMLRHHGKVILSLEQFERDVQSHVNSYLKGEIGEWSLRHFGRAWDNYESSYRPLVELAKTNNMPVIAANAPKDTVLCVGRNGIEVLENLPNERKNQVASSFHLPEHGAYFEKFTQAMSHGAKAKVNKRTLDRYHAQIVRDDTMAESIIQAMEKHPEHKLVHLNGHFHSASGLGTVERVKMRQNSTITVIQPIVVDDITRPSFTKSDIAKGDYLLLIQALPIQVIADKNRQLWMKEAFKRSEQDCSFGANEKHHE